MNDRFRIVGIDLATEPKGTGVVLLKVLGTAVSASLPPSDFIADDDGLTKLVDSHTTVGLDAPLGWPREFVEALVKHDAFEQWPTPHDLIGIEVRRLLCQRHTDREVHKRTGITPLSVSANLLGATAMRGALLQSAWANAWGQLEPRDGSSRLVEAYPAASIQVWELVQGKYKGGTSHSARSDQRGIRLQMMETIVAATDSWLTLGEVKQASIDSDDVLDGLICALTALATNHLIVFAGKVGSTFQSAHSRNSECALRQDSR
jgi:hypothetical protein